MAYSNFPDSYEERISSDGRTGGGGGVRVEGLQGEGERARRGGWEDEGTEGNRRGGGRDDEGKRARNEFLYLTIYLFLVLLFLFTNNEMDDRLCVLISKQSRTRSKLRQLFSVYSQNKENGQVYCRSSSLKATRSSSCREIR